MTALLRHLVLWLIVCIAGCHAAATRPGTETGPVSERGVCTGTTLAAPDIRFNRLFTRFEGGWTGADGTYSVGLPDGRTVWIFGDTFLGRVNPDRSRPLDTPFIRNSMVIQRGDRLTTLYAGSGASARALVTPEAADEWYWPGDGTVENETLRVFFHRFRKTGPDPWQWVWTETALAVFALPQVSLQSLTPLADGKKVMYGSSILETADYTYIYGTEDHGMTKYAHLARARAGQLEGAWEYFAGPGWTDDPQRSLRLMAGVANQYSVLAVDDGFLLLTMDNRTPFSDRLVAYLASTVFGPWQGPVTVYTAPEVTGDVAAYNAFAHPQFTTDGCLLVSYNLNSVSDLSLPYADADTYRPRFVRVNVARLTALLSGSGQSGLERNAR